MSRQQSNASPPVLHPLQHEALKKFRSLEPAETRGRLIVPKTLNDYCVSHRYKLVPFSGELVIKGKFGHLYEDGGELMICYSDDGVGKAVLNSKKKSWAIKHLGDNLIKLKQEGDAEFTARIKPAGIATALKLIKARGVRADKGQSRPFGKKNDK